MEHNNDNPPRRDAPRRDERAHDDNRDNRVQERQPDQKQDRSPDMRAYTVIDRGQDQKPFWREIGSAHRHEDGKGITVHTDALPHDGKIVLREQRKEAFKEKRTVGREGQNQSRSQEKPAIKAVIDK